MSSEKRDKNFARDLSSFYPLLLLSNIHMNDVTRIENEIFIDTTHLKTLVINNILIICDRVCVMQ